MNCSSQCFRPAACRGAFLLDVRSHLRRASVVGREVTLAPELLVEIHQLAQLSTSFSSNSVVQLHDWLSTLNQSVSPMKVR